MTKRKAWCVVYRTGGTERFTWHRSMPYATREEANESLASVQRMGYAAHVEDHALSVSIGLPETFGDGPLTVCEDCGEHMNEHPTNAYPIGGGVAYVCDGCRNDAVDINGDPLFGPDAKVQS